MVALSGGVDSAVMALLLLNENYDLRAVTMSLYEEKFDLPPSASCFSSDENEKILEVVNFCRQYEIPHSTVDLSREYTEVVLKNFVNEYHSGRTPNPCILCNQFVKLGALFEKSCNILGDFDCFCTGHYAKIYFPDKNFLLKSGFSSGEASELEEEKIPMIKKARDLTKDQSYFLYRLALPIRKKLYFPLGDMTKADVRAFAAKNSLSMAEKKDSQDFIPMEFLPKIFSFFDKKCPEGDFVSPEGIVLGKHKGICNYTIGQRRGLGISWKSPLYVEKIIPGENKIVVAEKSFLAKKFLMASDWFWPTGFHPKNEFMADVKIRAASNPVLAKVIPVSSNTCRIEFTDTVYGIAPGQSAVAYIDDVIVGGGIIE